MVHGFCKLHHINMSDYQLSNDHHVSSDVRRSKLFSGSASCDICKSPISILQKKAIGELYPVVPVSSCAFNVMLILIFSHTNFH